MKVEKLEKNQPYTIVTKKYLRNSSKEVRPKIWSLEVKVSNQQDIAVYSTKVPRIAKEGLRREHWKQAMEDEINALRKNGT